MLFNFLSPISRLLGNHLNFIGYVFSLFCCGLMLACFCLGFRSVWLKHQQPPLNFDEIRRRLAPWKTTFIVAFAIGVLGGFVFWMAAWGYTINTFKKDELHITARCFDSDQILIGSSNRCDIRLPEAWADEVATVNMADGFPFTVTRLSRKHIIKCDGMRINSIDLPINSNITVTFVKDKATRNMFFRYEPIPEELSHIEKSIYTHTAKYLPSMFPFEFVLRFGNKDYSQKYLKQFLWGKGFAPRENYSLNLEYGRVPSGYKPFVLDSSLRCVTSGGMHFRFEGNRVPLFLGKPDDSATRNLSQYAYIESDPLPKPRHPEFRRKLGLTNRLRLILDDYHTTDRDTYAWHVSQRTIKIRDMRQRYYVFQFYNPITFELDKKKSYLLTSRMLPVEDYSEILYNEGLPSNGVSLKYDDENEHWSLDGNAVTSNKEYICNNTLVKIPFTDNEPFKYEFFLGFLPLLPFLLLFYSPLMDRHSANRPLSNSWSTFQWSVLVLLWFLLVWRCVLAYRVYRFYPYRFDLYRESILSVLIVVSVILVGLYMKKLALYLRTINSDASRSFQIMRGEVHLTRHLYRIHFIITIILLFSIFFFLYDSASVFSESYYDYALLKGYANKIFMGGVIVTVMCLAIFIYFYRMEGWSLSLQQNLSSQEHTERVATIICIAMLFCTLVPVFFGNREALRLGSFRVPLSLIAQIAYFWIVAWGIGVLIHITRANREHLPYWLCFPLVILLLFPMFHFFISNDAGYLLLTLIPGLLVFLGFFIRFYGWGFSLLNIFPLVTILFCTFLYIFQIIHLRAFNYWTIFLIFLQLLSLLFFKFRKKILSWWIIIFCLILCALSIGTYLAGRIYGPVTAQEDHEMPRIVFALHKEDAQYYHYKEFLHSYPSVVQTFKAISEPAWWTGCGYGNNKIEDKGLHKSFMNDHVSSCLIIAEWGELMIILLIGLFCVFGLCMGLACMNPKFSKSTNWTSGLFLIGLVFSIVVPGVYMPLSNMGLVPCTGKNIPLLGLDSLSEAFLYGFMWLLILYFLDASRDVDEYGI